MTDGLPPYPTPTGSGRDEKPASLARRVAPAVVVLGAAGGLLLALDHPGTASSGTEAAGSRTSGGGRTAQPSTAPNSSSGSQAGSGTSTTVPGTPSCSGKAVTGDTVSSRYGPVQVKITIDTSGKVCAADATSYPNNDRKSQAINSRAVPQLDQKAVAAGTTSFNGVSGATYTSNGYKKSLQSALDKG